MNGRRLITCLVAALLSILAACAAPAPHPMSPLTAQQAPHVIVVGALDTQLTSMNIGTTIFQNSISHRDVGWNINPTVERIVRDYYRRLGFDVSDEAPDNGPLLNKKVYHPGFRQLLLNDDVAAYVCTFASDHATRVVVVITELANAEDPVTWSSVPLEGYGFYRRNALAGTTLASYLPYVVIAYDCRVHDTIDSMSHTSYEKLTDIQDTPIDTLDDASLEKLKASLTKVSQTDIPNVLRYVTLDVK